MTYALSYPRSSLIVKSSRNSGHPTVGNELGYPLHTLLVAVRSCKVGSLQTAFNNAKGICVVDFLFQLMLTIPEDIVNLVYSEDFQRTQDPFAQSAEANEIG